MKPLPGKRRVLVFGGVALAAALLIRSFLEGGMFADETTGMTDLGVVAGRSAPQPVTDSAGQAYSEKPEFEYVDDQWNTMREPSLWAARQKPGFEAYRFTYSPSFHPQVCIRIWREGEIVRLRASALVRHPLDAELPLRLYAKERTINRSAWRKLQATFRDEIVRDPMRGKERGTWLDGSEWTMEWVVDGQYGRANVWSPGDAGRLFYLIPVSEPREPEFAAFFETGLQILDLARVKVGQVY